MVFFSVTQNGKHWQPLSIDSTLERYSRILHSLVQAVLLSMAGLVSSYQFPLGPSDIQAGNNLLACLEQPKEKETVSSLHSFVYQFLSAKNSTGTYDKWQETLECFMAIYSLTSNGNYEGASSATHLFAIIKYLCRGSTLYEAFRISEMKKADPHRYGEHYLNLKF